MYATEDQLDREIIPALFAVLPDAFPEFGFKKTAKGYKSTTGWKVTHERGDSNSAVSITEEMPYFFKDWTRGNKSIYTYVKEREGLDNYHDVVRKLAELAGVPFREQQLSPEQEERFRWANKQAELWEAANDFFIECLSLESNEHAQTNRANQVREYLSNPLEKGGRGYSAGLFRLAGQVQDTQRPRMELGYIPDIFVLRDYLINEGFETSDVTPLIRGLSEMPEQRIGKQNVLTFPYRDHVGRIKGMVFRSLAKNDPVKYLYSPGLKRNGILFNLNSVARNSDLVVVESPLDALHASALGIKNVTALGGSGDTLNKTQIDLAIRYGAIQITLMLDNDSIGGVDHAGAKGTEKALAFLQKEYPTLKVYVGQYPEGIKDLDELLINKGEEGFYQVKDSALAAWRYQLYRLLTHYSTMGELGDKQIEQLTQEVILLGSKLNRIDSDSLISEYAFNPGIKELGVSEESIKQVAEQIRKSELLQKQQESLQDLFREARKESDSGNIGKALDLLKQRSIEIKGKNKADQFAALSEIVSQETMTERIRNTPPALESGFMLGKEPLLISSKAITLIAGGTNHGKSILLGNLALSLANLNPKKTFHIFSYEVDEERYRINLLNAYIGDNELAKNNRESIEHYFRGKTHIARKGLFEESDRSYPLFNSGKEHVFYNMLGNFFSDLIDSGRIKIHYVTYDSDTLIDAIHYLNRTESVGAVLIDYIQLINLPTGKLSRASRQEEVKQMCQDFKDLTLETGLPLIFGAQFNRQVDNLLQMKDSALGEAGDLERISDQIIGIWNCSKKWRGTPSKQELAAIGNRIALDEEGLPAHKNTWYIEALKRRGGSPDAWDIWDYLPNAGKVMSPKSSND